LQLLAPAAWGPLAPQPCLAAAVMVVYRAKQGGEGMTCLHDFLCSRPSDRQRETMGL